MLSSAVFVLSTVMVVGQAGDRMPANLRDQIDKHLIGEWTIKTTVGNDTTTGTYTARWTSGRQAVLIAGTSQDKSGKFEWTELVGWDAKRNELFSLSFDSRGGHGFLHWQERVEDKWTGQGTGFWNGKVWESAIAVEWKDNEFRYEDTIDGAKSVLVATRKR